MSVVGSVAGRKGDVSRRRPWNCSDARAEYAFGDSIPPDRRLVVAPILSHQKSAIDQWHDIAGSHPPVPAEPRRNRTRRIPALLAAFALASGLHPARADDVAVEVLWQACPYLVGTAASVALRRLTLPADDIAAVAEVACQAAQAYQDLGGELPAVPPDDPRTAEEIFCEGSYLDACAGVEGAAEVSPAMRCAVNGMTVEECAVATIEAEAGRR